jgi:hypothetical protein
MVRRSIIIAAIAAYLGIMLLGVRASKHEDLGSGPAVAYGGNRAAFADVMPYRGVAMQIQRTDWIDSYAQSIDKIADLGADTIILIVDSRMENGGASRIYLDLRTTPTVPQISELIDKAKSRKLRVILMPIVLLDKPRSDTEWRGSIKPENWDDWFDSYRAMITHYAGIAKDHHVDVLTVGSELVSSEEHPDQWALTIKSVRSIFQGQLTYSSNWDHYTDVPFWDKLDMIGINGYWKFTDDVKHVPTDEEISKHWREIQGSLLPWVAKTGKPMMFIEIGYFSMSNSAFEPWDYTKTDMYPVDLDLQKRLYEGFFQAWADPEVNRLLAGYTIFEWSPDKSGSTDKGYTPQGKPAEDVLRQWFAKPKWKVE